MLEEEGRRYASNPQTPLGLVKRWLRKVVNLPEERNGHINYPPRRAIVRVAQISLSELGHLPDKTRVGQISPTPAMVRALKGACKNQNTCYFTEYRTLSSFLNDLSALVHRYEAVALSKKISRLVYASEDAKPELIDMALKWEKHLLTLHKHGLISQNPDELFALATDRLDLRIGLSPGHLTRVKRHTAEYFDPDLDAVYSLGELHRRHGGKLMAKRGEHAYLFWNPASIPEVWAVAVSQDWRNLLFRRLFHDVMKRKPASLSRALELADRLFRSYSPEFERKKLYELLLDSEEALELCLEEVAFGVISALKSPDEREYLENFSVGRAGGIASDVLINTLLGDENEN